MTRTLTKTTFNWPAVPKVDRTPKRNQLLFSKAPRTLGFGRPAQSSAAQP
jgi:hypothetical protein